MRILRIGQLKDVLKPNYTREKNEAKEKKVATKKVLSSPYIAD